jgi:signal transduction histidine kinase
MKIERFRQLDYQLKPRLANYPRAVFDRANVDPTMLQMAAQQDERKRIAQELHDTLLQGFTGIAAAFPLRCETATPADPRTNVWLPWGNARFDLESSFTDACEQR